MTPPRYTGRAHPDAPERRRELQQIQKYLAMGKATAAAKRANAKLAAARKQLAQLKVRTPRLATRLILRSPAPIARISWSC